MADQRLLDELGVTARGTADVERDVIAAAYAAQEGGDGDGSDGDGEAAPQPQPGDEEVVRARARSRCTAASGACKAWRVFAGSCVTWRRTSCVTIQRVPCQGHKR